MCPSDSTFKQVVERLQRQCARMESCSADVYRKALKALDGDREAASRAVEELVRDGFVDDRRYAAAFVREKAALSGWGRVKISYMLQGKGIAKEIVADAWEEMDPDAALRRLEKLALEKYRALEGDPQRRLKMLRYLLGRGYEYEEVTAIIDKIVQK